MHKLECSAMCSFGESWCPSETVRLVARIITRMVSAQSFFFPYVGLCNLKKGQTVGQPYGQEASHYATGIQSCSRRGVSSKLCAKN